MQEYQKELRQGEYFQLFLNNPYTVRVHDVSNDSKPKQDNIQ